MDRARRKHSVFQENSTSTLFSGITTIGGCGTGRLAPIESALPSDRSIGASHVQEVCFRSFSSTKGKRRLAFSGRLETPQPALHSSAVQVRDIKGPISVSKARGLDVCIRPPGRLPLRKHSSSAQEVLHVPGERGVLPVRRPSVRLAEQSLCLYKVNASGGRVPQGTSGPPVSQAQTSSPSDHRPLAPEDSRYSSPALSRRLYGDLQQLPGSLGGSDLHPGHPSGPRAKMECEEVPLDPYTVPYPPGSPSRYAEGAVFSHPPKDEETADIGQGYFVPGSPGAAVRPSEASGPIHRVGQQYAAGGTTSQILPARAVQRYRHPGHVGKFCTTNSPGITRHQVVAASQREKLGQSHLEVARERHTTLRRLRPGLGRGSQQLRARSRLLAVASEATAHHVEGVMRRATDHRDIPSFSEGQACQTLRRQPVGGCSVDSPDLPVHCINGRTQETMGHNRLSSDRSKGGVHQVRGQQVCGPFVQAHAAGGLETESQSVPFVRQQVGASHSGQVRHIQQQTSGKVQLRVPRATVRRSRRFRSKHPALAQREQLGKSALVIAQPAGPLSRGFWSPVHSSCTSVEGAALVQAAPQHYRRAGGVSSQQRPVFARSSGLPAAPGYPLLGCHGVQSTSQTAVIKSIFLKVPVAARQQKYTCTAVSSVPAPWQDLIQQVAADRYGSVTAPEVQSLLRAWTSSLSPATYTGYFSKFRKFAEFCLERHLSPLPAQDATVELFLGWMLSEGRVAAHLFPQYLSAIRAVHRDLLLPLPNSSVMSLITQGGKHLQKALVITQESFPLPADAVVDFIFAGLSSGNLVQVRALCAVSVAFAFCCRGSTGQGMFFDDLKVVSEPPSLVLVESVRKGHTHQDRTQRSLVVDVSKLPALLSLVQLFQGMQREAFGPDTTPTHFWQLPGENLAQGTHFETWFYQCLEVVPVSVPDGFKLHPHCVRKGAASAARAIGVALEKICRLGGWKLGSKSVWQYIDPMVKSSKGAALFFGWLLPTAVDTLLTFV